MPREDSPYIVGEYWLDKRRDGKSPDIWQIARYAPASRSVIYRSTHERGLEDAKPKIIAHAAAERAKGKQQPHEAQVVPLMVTYWQERGKGLINHDQTARSLRTFAAFLMQDSVGAGAVVTDLTPVLFDRFRTWRMGQHSFKVRWSGQEFDYASEGVSGDTVDRNINDVRAAVNHAEANMRIPYAPKIRMVAPEHRNARRERVLSDDEMARLFWYARQHSPALFRFVALQLATAVRPDAAKKFNPVKQYNDRFGYIDLQPEAAPRTKKRNAVLPAIRPMRVVLRAWSRDGYKPVDSNKTAWRNMRKVLGLSDDVHAKTIRHTIATLLHHDPSVPGRQVSELLGHGTDMNRTTMLYAKYNPDALKDAVRALTRIWLRTSRNANAYGADHLLTTGPKGRRIIVDRTKEES